MSYETRAYDKPNNNGFPPDPVVVLVATGTHDVSRLVHLLRGAPPVIEQISLGDQVLTQVRQHAGGRAALALLKAHGGADFTQPDEQQLASSLGHCRSCDRTICTLSADDPCSGCCECSGGGICLDLIEAAVTAVEKTMAALAALSPEERHENAQHGQSDAERIALAALRAADEVVR